MKVAKVAISMPDELLEEIEAARVITGETRSEFIRRAAVSFLRDEREKELEERYVEGYRRLPETAEEAGFAEATSKYAFLDNPWEEDEDCGAR